MGRNSDEGTKVVWEAKILLADWHKRGEAPSQKAGRPPRPAHDEH